MGWSSGTYSKGNAATGGWTGDAAGGIGIEAGRHDTQDNDFASGINNCLTKDGQNTPTANLPMGGFKHTGVADANGTGQYVTYNQLRDNTFNPSLGSSDINSTSTFLFNATKFSNDANPVVITLAKARGAAIGSFTIVQNGDGLGRITFAGANGTATNDAVRIIAEVDGVPGATNDMPGRLIFATTADGAGSPSERLRIDSVGRVAANGVPTSPSQFDITSGAASRRALTVYSTPSADLSTPSLGVVKWDNDTSPSNRFVQFWVNNGAAQSGGIAANGANQAIFVSISDERLKENIVNLSSQLANVMALRPVEFDYKDGAGHQIGFIAQDVQSIYPDLVSQNSDGFLNLAGLGKNEARLIKAFQEFAQLAEGKIATLETRIAALENA